MKFKSVSECAFLYEREKDWKITWKRIIIALQLHTWGFCQMGMHQQVIFISADVLALYSTFITPFYTPSSCSHFSMVASK